MGTNVTQPASPTGELSERKAESTKPRKRRTAWFVVAIIAILIGIAIFYLRYDLRSYILLSRFAGLESPRTLLQFETGAVSIENMTISTPGGPIRARLYRPLGVAHPHGMVVVHGIHHLGIDEPRLEAFSQAAASTGLAVLTPEVASLADYHVDRD